MAVRNNPSARVSTVGRVQVVPYDPSWPQQFETERRQLLEAVPDLAAVEHIGSTAVPGLPAKPTIDILAITADLPGLLVRLDRLAAIGYEFKPGSFPDDPHHLFLRKLRDARRTHHLHVLAKGHPAIEEYRLFRDFLRSVPEAAHAYGAIKVRLAARYGENRPGYVEAKEIEVDRLMEKARVWSAHTTEPGC